MTVAIAHTTPADRAACERLARLGVTVFELDVRIVAGRLVATHFVPLLPRVELFRRHNWRVRLGPPRTTDMDALAAAAMVPTGCRVLLDCKDDSGRSAHRLVGGIRSEVQDQQRFLVSSHSWGTLRPLSAAGFEVWASVGTRWALARALADDIGCDAVTVRHSLLTREVVERLHTTYGQVVAWTVNDPERVRQLLPMEVDGIAADNPEVLRLVAALDV